jgi:hypothetical protein
MSAIGSDRVGEVVGENEGASVGERVGYPSVFQASPVDKTIKARAITVLVEKLVLYFAGRSIKKTHPSKQVKQSVHQS